MASKDIEKACDEWQRVSEEEVLWERAWARDKFLSDQATRKEQAELEGRKKGRSEGRKEGRKEGRSEGKSEGRNDAILAMYNNGGMPIEEIAAILGLAVEEVTSIINQVH